MLSGRRSEGAALILEARPAGVSAARQIGSGGILEPSDPYQGLACACIAYECRIRGISETDPAAPACHECGVAATVPPPGSCLDGGSTRHSFNTHARGDSHVPPYSAMPQQRCLSVVIDAPRWPGSFAVIQTSQGCTVGRRVRGDVEYLYFHVVAAADNLPLAICRAAVCAARAT